MRQPRNAVSVTLTLFPANTALSAITAWGSADVLPVVPVNVLPARDDFLLTDDALGACPIALRNAANG